MVYDEVDLELGRIRLRSAGSAAGHRGMESVIQNLRTEGIPRLRLGIGESTQFESEDDLSSFVISPFRADERDLVDDLVLRAADACESWLREGTDVTMNRFNT